MMKKLLALFALFAACGAAGFAFALRLWKGTGTSAR